MSTEEDARKLFIAGLPDSVTEDVLRQLVEATGGTVRSLSLPRDRETGRPRGFGFVTLSTAEEAAAARDSLDGSMQAGRAISVRPFQSEAPRRGEAPAATGGAGGAGGGPDRTLYVGNLPYDVTVEAVEEMFATSGAGRIVRVHLPTGPDGRLRGFGFVTMGSSEAANEAIVQLRSAEMGGRRLVINIAHPKGERPERGDRPRPRDAATARPSPRSSDPDPAMLEALGEPPRAPEGRRRAVKPERSESDNKRRNKKRGASAADRTPERRRKQRRGDWKDWDED
jgi:RNA recognition motif-containing protein